MRERGLKFREAVRYHVVTASLPMRERGLKCEIQPCVGSVYMSLPMRERGLKYVDLANDISFTVVAPHAGSVD